MKLERLHYLDALRAFAMYLGIVLHVCIPILPWYEDYEMKEIYSIISVSYTHLTLPTILRV